MLITIEEFRRWFGEDTATLGGRPPPKSVPAFQAFSAPHRKKFRLVSRRKDERPGSTSGCYSNFSR